MEPTETRAWRLQGRPRFFDPQTVWDNYFDVPEADVREDVVSGSTSALFDFFGFDYPTGLLSVGPEPVTIYNFSEVSENGTVSLEIVPEPSSYAFLLGLAALSSIVIRRRARG